MSTTTSDDTTADGTAVATDTSTTTAAKRSLGSAAIQSALTASQNAAMTMQVYTQTVLRTPDITLPEQVDTESHSTVRTDLPIHQATARKNAQHYLDSVNPTLSNCVAGVLGFGNLWNSEYERLVGYAQQIDVGTNRELFAQGLENLRSQAQVKQTDTAAAVEAVRAFAPLVTLDSTNLTSDAEYVMVAYGGEQGDIARLKAAIERDNADRGKYIAVIVGGVATAVGGVVMILVGSLATIATAGLAASLVVAGVTLAVGGTAAMLTAAVDLGTLDTRISQESKQLAEDELAFTSVAQASHSVSALETAVTGAAHAVYSLQTSWQQLDDELATVVNELAVAGPDAGSWLESMLTEANTEWNQALTIARNLQANGVMPVKSEGAGS